MPPTSCWVLTDLEHKIKQASDEWYSLWGYSPHEVVGQPITILNGPGHDKVASSAVISASDVVAASAVRCRNTTKSGQLFEHDLVIKNVEEGLLGTSTGIAAVRRMGARDSEVFDDDDMPTAPVNATVTDDDMPTVKRVCRGRDDEYFGNDDVEEVPAQSVHVPATFLPRSKLLSARDVEVFAADEPEVKGLEPIDGPTARRKSGRDDEYDMGDEEVLPAAAANHLYRDGSTRTIRGARDIEVFEDGIAPSVSEPLGRPMPYCRMSRSGNEFDD